MQTAIPRLLVAGLSGDGGKTLVALGLCAALRRRGRAVAACKKGPDYIDAAWLGLAAGRPAVNLDTYLMGSEVTRASFIRHAQDADISVIEGNRGLYDGSDAGGAHSSAALAKLVGAPVLLVVNAAKATRTLAALVLGCQKMDPEVRFAGVVLNQIGGERHARVAREAIETVCGIPVLGVVPKLADAGRIPGRHLGLVPVDEFPDLDGALSLAADVAEKYLDLDRLLALAAEVEPLSVDSTVESVRQTADATIGVLRDGAFSFYYPENLEALRQAGATVAPIRSMADEALPDIDALYIGGGFPETHAERLVQNAPLRRAIAEAARAGLPIYAECGGLMYLAREIRWQGKAFPMCGVLPLVVQMHDRPQGHGYAELTVDAANPFYPVGTRLIGHEFHYSSVVGGEATETAGAVRRGAGLGNGRDGLVVGNVAAFYTHVHALGAPEWATGLVAAAQRFSAWKRQPASGRTDGAIRCAPAAW
ncbi:MAG: cobyrinate a,c-diamide synthase [Myxococcales bacterium]|nr:MAG: cobyrinate a,c-diamide synthase [Myxococcales bacterium]